MRSDLFSLAPNQTRGTRQARLLPGPDDPPPARPLPFCPLFFLSIFDLDFPHSSVTVFCITTIYGRHLRVQSTSVSVSSHIPRFRLHHLQSLTCLASLRLEHEAEITTRYTFSPFSEEPAFLTNVNINTSPYRVILVVTSCCVVVVETYTLPSHVASLTRTTVQTSAISDHPPKRSASPLFHHS